MFLRREDEKDKEETYKIYVDMAEAEVRAFVDMKGTTSTWHMANKNRKRIDELQRAVAALTVLVIITFFITLVLTVAIVWRII